MSDSNGKRDQFDTARMILADATGLVLATDPATRTWLLSLGKELAGNAQPTIGHLLPALNGETWNDIAASDIGDIVRQTSLAAGLAAETDLGGEVTLHIRRLEGASEKLFIVELVLHSLEQDFILRRDPVTGLFDRDALIAFFGAWKGENPAGVRLAVLFIDLDGFKQVNDNYGHTLGDRALAELARRWQACVRDSDVICRYGGDEFVALLKGVDTLEAASPVVERLRSATAEPLELDGRMLTLGVSIGVAIGGEGQVSLDDLIAEADRRMYAAKRGERS